MKMERVHPKPLSTLLSDTKGIQWADTDATLYLPLGAKGALAIES